jgi:hypothetical protein
MKNLSALKIQKRASGKAVYQLADSKTFSLALATFFILVVVSESIRLALLNW